MTSPQDVEYCLGRLAQLARAVGIHLVMATQRPSIMLLPGQLKTTLTAGSPSGSHLKLIQG